MDPTVRFDKREQASREPARPPRRSRIGRAIGLAVALAVALIAVVLVLSTVHLLPQFRNPFTETTNVSTPELAEMVTGSHNYDGYKRWGLNVMPFGNSWRNNCDGDGSLR